MSKNVILVFDDGRKDQYSNAVKIMKKYGLRGTIYITTGFVDGSLNGKLLFPSSGGDAMSIDDVRNCIVEGMEIGAHSDRHTNEIKDIIVSLNKLNKWTKGLLKSNYKFGFASPSSDIYIKNIKKINKIKDKVDYVRTSVQIKRNGLFYTLAFLINEIIRSKKIFYFLNKQYIKPLSDGEIIESVAIRANTPISHIFYLLEQIKEDQVCVLLFHGILNNKQLDKKVDCWYYDSDKFESLCRFLTKERFEVKTMVEALEYCRSRYEKI